MRSTDFTYHAESVAAFLASSRQTAYRRNPVDQSYTLLDPTTEDTTKPALDAAGRVHVLRSGRSTRPVRDVAADALEESSYGVDGTQYRWLDLDSEGSPGVLTEQAEGWFYKRNLSNLPRDDHGTVLPNDAAESAPVRAAFEPMQLVATPTLDWPRSPAGGSSSSTSPATGSNAWCSSTGRCPATTRGNEAGHGSRLSLARPARVAQALDEEKGPALVFADGTSRSTSPTCPATASPTSCASATARSATGPTWATAASAPRSRWTTRRGSTPRPVRPAAHPAGRHRRLRHHRHHLSRPRRRAPLLQPVRQRLGEPQPHAASSRASTTSSAVTAIDLLGNGTACLVWSSPLPGDARPADALRRPDGRPEAAPADQDVKNNLGAETRVQYAPSTKFYLQDKRDGKPWITRLPFPGARRRARRDLRPHQPQPLRHPLRLPPRLLRRRGARVPRLRHGRAVGSRPPPPPNHPTRVPCPVLDTQTWFHTGAYLQAAASACSSSLACRSQVRGRVLPRASWLPDDVLPATSCCDDTICPWRCP